MAEFCRCEPWVMMNPTPVREGLIRFGYWGRISAWEPAGACIRSGENISRHGHQLAKFLYNSRQLDIITSSLPTGDGCVRKQTGVKSAAYLSTVVAMLCASTAMASDDNSTFGTVSDMLGITSNKQMEKIDYSERPKLVMPPKVDQLPAPRERQLPEGWPVDADSGTRRTDRFARHPNAPPEKPKPTLLEHLHGPHRKQTDPPKAEEEGDGGGILGSWQNLRENRKRLNEDEGPAPMRNLLSEPPDGLRTPTQDLSKIKDTDKKDSWWGLFGSSEIGRAHV